MPGPVAESILKDVLQDPSKVDSKSRGTEENIRWFDVHEGRTARFTFLCRYLSEMLNRLISLATASSERAFETGSYCYY